ncbi:MGDG synthase family glycosyltransferase [Carnobacterium sp.]|uniref:MGDG synthase family glycosyltransferase n=1 Tax=Carnobacterium sp. TaxID=48221 RepID=UPI003C72D116
MKSPKILILTGSYGNGHLEVTNALVAELNKRGITDIVISDLFYEAHPILTHFTKQLYLKSFTKGQNIYGFLYYNSDARLTDFRIDRMIDRYGYIRISQLMSTYEFDVVINTFPMQALPIYKQKNRHNIPFINVLTDFCLHSRWLSDEIDHFFVAGDSLKDELTDSGISPDKITISGIPIKEEFYSTKAKAIRPSSTSDCPKKVLISAGAFGVIKNLPLLIEELHLNSNLDITVICGRNLELYTSLQTRFKGISSIRILGYVEDMASLMNQADIMVSKPGGISLSEALAIQVPLVLTPAVPGQELDNAKLFEQKGMAILSYEEEQIAPAVLYLLKNPSLIAEIKGNMKDNFKPNAAAKIIDKVLSIVNVGVKLE